METNFGVQGQLHNNNNLQDFINEDDDEDEEEDDLYCNPEFIERAQLLGNDNPIPPRCSSWDWDCGFGPSYRATNNSDHDEIIRRRRRSNTDNDSGSDLFLSSSTDECNSKNCCLMISKWKLIGIIGLSLFQTLPYIWLIILMLTRLYELLD